MSARFFQFSSLRKQLLSKMLFLGVITVGMLAMFVRGAGFDTQEASAATESDEEILWKLEQEFYARRGAGDLAFYVENSDPSYAVWAPTWEKPNGYKELVDSAKQLQGTTAGETIVPEKKLIRISRDGNVGLVFYSTHRTTLPGGAPADDRFDTLHVWLKSSDGWRLMGGMARPVPASRLGASKASQSQSK